MFNPPGGSRTKGGIYLLSIPPSNYLSIYPISSRSRHYSVLEARNSPSYLYIYPSIHPSSYLSRFRQCPGSPEFAFLSIYLSIFSSIYLSIQVQTVSWKPGIYLRTDRVSGKSSSKIKWPSLSLPSDTLIFNSSIRYSPHSMQYTQCTVHSIIVYSTQYTQFTVHSIHSLQYTVYKVYSTQYNSVQYTVNIVIVHSIHSVQYTV